ncbi:unnamed protein product [Adineta steineri]|uniref:F-box domain-containing protein n=1 Tax=Adineta steineri TaxID=433720 RepID=A0A814ZCQ5_9BILA|nr:unnamed protein product [Adineta steineri]
MNQSKQNRMAMMEFENNKRKKLQRIYERKNCIENLPNEIFYEIFDYLEGCLLYEAFSNLNYRFQQLLIDSSVRLKINFVSYSGLLLEQRSKHIVIPKRHQIISFNFDNAFGESPIFTWFPINSQFNRLESITLRDIRTGELLLLLVDLVFLPRLFSLTIYLHKTSKDLSYLYKLIFNLPKLKYHKLSFRGLKINNPLLMATNKQLSTIEYLVIDHICTLNEFITILSYTPRLSHLICKQIVKSNQIMKQQIPIKLIHLIHMCIRYCYLRFDEIEDLIKKIGSQFHKLRIHTYKDFTYLDADRWEQLIIQHMPKLHLFKFKYTEMINEHLQITPCHTQINRFHSLFWSQRQWVFNLSIDTDNQQAIAIVYSIHSCRKKQDEFDQYLNDNIRMDNRKSIQQIITPYSQSNQLTVVKLPTIDIKESCINMIQPILLLTSITVLNIAYNKISVAILLKLIDFLPNLDYLLVKSFTVSQLRTLSKEELATVRLTSTTNKITRVNFQQITELAEMQFFMNICPHMQHLVVNCTCSTQAESILRFILTKKTNCITSLCSICFCISNLNNDLSKNLVKTFQLEKFYSDYYTIQQINNRIYIQLNKK